MANASPPSTHDEFLQAEFDRIARPDDQIISTAIGWTGLGVLLQAMMLGLFGPEHDQLNF